MTTFAERRKSLPLQLALEGRRWTLYQFKSAENDQMNWGMKVLRRFISVDDLVRWENGRQQVKRFIESNEVLSSLVKFVQADEVGEDYLIHAKPPYDGGYSLAMLHDSRRPMRPCCSDTILPTHFPFTAQRLDEMRTAIYYSLMLLLGFACYKFGQTLLRKPRWNENGERTEGLVGPVGLFVITGMACYLLFAFLRALVRGKVPYVGKACRNQIYTLAANAGGYWTNMFTLAWLALGLSYAVYVTLKIWFRA